MNAHPRMTLRRLRTLTASYGADLNRWPPEERTRASSLLDVSRQATMFLRQAAVTDGWLVSAKVHEEAQLWPVGVPAAALARLRAGVGGRIAETPQCETLWRALPGTTFNPNGVALMPTLGTFTAFGITGAAGLCIGWLQGAMSMSHTAGRIMLLLSGPMNGLAW